MKQHNPLSPTKTWHRRLAIALALLLAVPVAGGVLVLQLPATLLASYVSSATQGNVRMVLPTGNVQAGHAELWVRDAARREWQPWLPLNWAWSLSWPQGAPALTLTSNIGALTLGRSGVSVAITKANLPPGLLLSGVSHPLASAPWQGDIQISTSQFFCTWSGLRQPIPACEGTAALRWLAMGSSVLPLQNFGNYATLLSAQSSNGAAWRAELTTESGAVNLNGFFEHKQGRSRYRISIKGDNALIGGLNNIAGPGFRKNEAAGEFVLEGA